MNTSKTNDNLKESQVYLNFLINNKYLTSVPLLLSITVSLLTYSSLPTYYSTEGMWEVIPNKEAVDLTDNTVAILRSENVHQELKLQSKVLAYKPGTLLVTLNTTSQSKSVSEEDFNKMESYITKKAGLKKLGETVYTSQKIPIYLYTSFASIIGLSFGLFISLIKAYFKNY